ncbi:MAG: DNA ligase D [Parachlamydiaceae bacterium]
MSLKKYLAKRFFSQTPEPRGKPNKKHPLLLHFSIQKHDASRLHYDLRLEHRGVLLSWAIPKGPSLNPKDKRLALQVEDHPLEYRTFEGLIPEGNYGAGTVLLWDEGTYTVPNTKNVTEAEEKIALGLLKGHLEVIFEGIKLKGEFHLIKLVKNKEENAWLLVKKQDSYASEENILEHTDSVKTKKVKTKKPFPGFFKPMLATLINAPFDHDDWLFEVKWDGYRALAFVNHTHVNLYSRNHKSFNQLFPTLVSELKKHHLEVVLDGEIVLLDEHGRSQFQYMQNYQSEGSREGALYYYVFDLLFENGEDLRSLPLIERKERLNKLFSYYPFIHLKLSEHVQAQGIALFHQAVQHRLEGIIGKRITSSYTSTRSKEWVKIKTHLSQEAVIGGFTAPRGSRKKFGALLLGVYEDGKLSYIGHTGGGFDQKSLSFVYEKLRPLIQDECPFFQRPKANSPVTWVEPKLVCAISLSQWTKEGVARQPIFQGLRFDKNPLEVTREPIQMVNSKEVKVSNLEKIYWPDQKYTKGDLLRYYQKVASLIIPYLKNRAIMIRRFPDGIEGDSFYQKDSSSLHLPKEMKTISIEHDHKKVQYLVVENKKALEYLVNLGVIEIHVFLSQIDQLENPDFLVIDLDPEAISFNQVIETALVIHDILDSYKIKNYCKTSGGDGLHICIPLHAKYSYEQSKRFGELIARLAHNEIPKITSLERKPEKRQKKVYIDVYQNNFGQTIVAPYSVRGRPFATVSTPLLWEEVRKGLLPSQFTIQTVPDRVKKMGDIFKPIFGKGIDILKIIETLEEHF